MGVLPIMKADISKPRDYMYLLSKQYDNLSRQYKLVITDNGSLYQNMTDETLVRIRMWAEGEAEPYVDKWLDDPWVEGCPVLTFTNNMLSKVGNVTYEFILQEPGSMVTVSTMPQNLDITRSLTNYLGLIESDDFDILSHLIAEAAVIPEILADITATKEEVEALIASVNVQMATYETEFNQMSTDLQNLMISIQEYMLDVENAAAASAKLSESWAIGHTGTRVDEDTNNSKFHSDQSKLEADRAKSEADRAEQYAGSVDPKTLSQVSGIDTYGILGGIGDTVSGQNLIDEMFDTHKSKNEMLGGIKTFTDNVFAPNLIGGNTIYGGTIIDNFNNIIKNGAYTGYGTAYGAPTTDHSWFIEHRNSNAGTVSAVQLAIAYDDNQIIYIRKKVNSAWGAWILQVSRGEFDNFVNNTNSQLSLINEEKADKTDLAITNAAVSLKADKTEVTNVMTPKGNIAYASLPTTGNTIGWYYYCADGDGTHGAGNYVWNGTAWYFGGAGDSGYSILKNDLQESIASTGSASGVSQNNIYTGSLDWSGTWLSNSPSWTTSSQTHNVPFPQTLTLH